jgi:photosynthetic reaction center cytochrome c subunit
MAALAGVALSATWMVYADEAVEPATAPTNLQVLPAQTSRAGVRSLMKQYERALGVSCNYCHVEDRDSGLIDYASDENPRKHTARLMISMLNDINDKHLAQLGGDRRYAQPVTCGSCHQGRATPQAFEP